MSKYWILTAALVLAACAKTEMDAPILKENPGEKVWNVQIDATKAAGPDTKAQAAEDGWEGEESTKALDNSVESRIDFYWGGTDYIRAYKEVDNGGKTDYVLVGTLTPKNVAGNNATLHGQITGTFSVNEWETISLTGTAGSAETIRVDWNAIWGDSSDDRVGTEVVQVDSNGEWTFEMLAASSGWYRITLNGEVKVEAADEDGAHYAAVTIDNLKRNAGGATVPNAVIEDWPDMGYRGIMLDVSRDFTSKDNLLKLIDLLDHYKVNRLHLHLGDDEGWRVEIAGLPELTSYGAYRGIPVLNEDGTISEPDALMPTYCVTPDRNDKATLGNGYYTKADFIEILRYAADRRIAVIPEFDMPGHSRAAIKSMEYRARTTGDASMLLSEPEDVSEYNSAQDYNDNAVNVALPTTYTFIDKVFDGVIALYAEAGVPLLAVHVGGDEVPDGAWKGSPACQALMAANGKTDIGWLKDYFINHVLDIAEAKGVKIAGWQEVGQHLEPATFERLKKNLAFTNFWAVSHGRDRIAYNYANDQVPVVLSNSSNTYFDLAYNPSKTERGHNWAGFVDERRSFSFLPYDFYRSVRWDDRGNPTDLTNPGADKPVLTAEGKPYIIGVQGQLWSETLRCFDHVTYYLFPKAVGLFERGWNADPAWAATTTPDDPAFTEDFNRFFSTVVDHEYPYYEAQGISWHKH